MGDKKQSNLLQRKNKNCYRFEIKKYNEPGQFDKCIDMAYVITMENSPRIPEFTKQLSEHIPSSTVMIQYNKGYRNCTKELPKNESSYDLSDALRNIFENACENKYTSVLVFEDDFFMDKELYNRSDTIEISNYINKNKPNVYNLGPLGHLSLPSFSKHNIVLTMSSCHGVIYNIYYMKQFIKDCGKKLVNHTDDYWQKFKFSKATYYKPIVFQLHPETENMKQWGGWKTKKEWLKYWKLDKTHKHYVEHFNLCTRLVWVVLIIIIVVIIIIIIACWMRRRRILASSLRPYKK